MILNISLSAADAQSGWKTGRAEPEKASADLLPEKASCDLGGAWQGQPAGGLPVHQIEQGSCLPEDRPPGT